MRNMKKLTLLITAILILGLFVGCGEKQPKVPEVKGKYTIWVGGDIIQIGKQAQDYKIENGMITFRDFKTGKPITVPMSNIGSIETN